MKSLLLILALLLPLQLVRAEGPIFTHKDPLLEQELDNAYRDIRAKQQRIPIMTKALLKATTPSAKNLLFICSDCTTDGLVISTATTVGGVSSATSRTTTIN